MPRITEYKIIRGPLAMREMLNLSKEKVVHLGTPRPGMEPRYPQLFPKLGNRSDEAMKHLTLHRFIALFFCHN